LVRRGQEEVGPSWWSTYGDSCLQHYWRPRRSCWWRRRQPRDQETTPAPCSSPRSHWWPRVTVSIY